MDVISRENLMLSGTNPGTDSEPSMTSEVFEKTRKTTQKAKSSQRLRYEAEVEVIKRKLGSLEDIRNQLGLPQRKLCQLLLVDPSAWSRWMRNGEDAPPHIYRQLQWYLALQEKYPALDAGFWLQTVARTTTEPAANALRDRKIEDLGQEIDRLRAEIEILSRVEPQKSEAAPLNQYRLLIWPLLTSTLLAGGALGFAIAFWVKPL